MELGALLLAWLGAGLSSCAGSTLDVETPKVFRGHPEEAFGHSLALFGTSDDGSVLVGAPWHRGDAHSLGAVYLCRYHSGTCQEVPIRGPPGATNGSLGLALASGPSGALVCAPRVPLACGENLHLNGFCAHLDANLQQLQLLPDAHPECPSSASDVAFLVDGSGSISQEDFAKMKTFIWEVLRRFQGTDTQFALTQFSHEVLHHFDFATFRGAKDPQGLLAAVRQLQKTTHTASAILSVLREIFTAARGAREGARKILIVVTDGKKFGDPLEYPQVIPEADRMQVTRYAIGVGAAFSKPDAVAELQAIASQPSQDHIFRVDNFDALEGIRKELQEKIFAIEGTQTAHSSSFQLEMAQEGFSALLPPEGPILGAVGAYDWSGGVLLYGHGGASTFVNVSQEQGRDMRDSYLGYSSESLSLGGRRALALGAPRYGHLGRVLLFHRPGTSWDLLAEATGTQVGSNFGASLCALDTDGDGAAEVLLVGAPMFAWPGGGGQVLLCGLKGQGGHLRCQKSLRGQAGHLLGRFGASLARLGHLDGDRWPEVGVGAPLEDEHRGALYIFRGTRQGLESSYSQRISAASFPSGPHFLGQALAGGRDLSGDLLPDVAVGAQGQVLLLRSRPLLKVLLKVTFQPQEIPAAAFDCQEGEEPQGEVAKVTFCFSCSKRTTDGFGSQLSTTVVYQAVLDPGRAMVRATFGANSGAIYNGSLQLSIGKHCRTLGLTFPGCPRDTLTPLALRLSYTASGDPLEVAEGLRPALSQDSQLVATGTLPFERNCGHDNLCVDDLRLSFNFSGLALVVVGVTPAVEVTFSLSNRGEDSYGARVQLQHPQSLSYRKVSVLQAARRSVSFSCTSEPAGQGWHSTSCALTPPILRAQDEVIFSLTLDVPHDANLGDSLELVANASSQNNAQEGPSQRQQLPVKYGVLLVLTSSQDSTSYLNISTASAHPPGAPLAHHYQVKVLGHRSLALNVTFQVPTSLGGASLWQHLEVTPDQELVHCWSLPEPPRGIPKAPSQLPDVSLLDCSVCQCQEFSCALPELQPPHSFGLRLGGVLALDWLLKSPQPRVVLQSSAELHFQTGKYWARGGGAQHQVQTELERVETPNPLPLILGGSLGGLLLLALLAWGLQRLGFFRRRYKEMLEEDETPQAPPAEPQD